MGSTQWVADGTARDILYYTHFSYPPVLLAIFLIVFTAHSVITASKDAPEADSTDLVGPGGKPLPKSTGSAARAKQKSIIDFTPGAKFIFDWLSVAVILTIIGNAAVVILHALIKRKHDWWCGQHFAVRFVHCI